MPAKPTPAAPVNFRTPAAFRAWLKRHHASEAALLVRIAKVHAADTGICYADALDEALCFGWIDGVRRRLDDDSFSIRFSPRKSGSIWSLANVRHVERLVAARRMQRAGLQAFEARRADRTGIYAFEQEARSLPAEFVREFRRDSLGWAYFQGEAPWYRRTSTHWVVRAKQEATRRRRFQILLDCSRAGLRIPTLRRP